ncbi:hypothetical protein F4777DRAFT_557340 [Nemania sp. FL0916]|nr:hypothetical protein F4777DRAFT_557340 [Nemania sp. FL0916]
MGYESPLNSSFTTFPTTTTTTITGEGATNRPQMPPLGATAARTMNRAPLTPKMASVSRPSQPATPSLATAMAATTTGMTTPLPRRTQQRPVSTAGAGAGAASGSASHRTSFDESNMNTSAVAFSPHLNSNVTPRSGSRQSRVDSANSTPTGTPSHDRSDRADLWDSSASFPFTTPLHQGDLPRRPLVTFSAVSPERTTARKQSATDPRDSKFFHASDAKTSRPTGSSKVTSPKTATFFYANGNDVPPPSASSAALSPPLSPGSTRSHENVSSKFMYANGTPELRPTPPPMVSRGSAPAVAMSSKGPLVRPTAAPQRPPSPSKLPLHSSSYRNSPAPQLPPSGAASAPTTRAQASPTPPLVSSAPGLRRSGTATSRSSGHSRSGSLARIEGAPEPFRPVASPTAGLSPPVNLSPTNPPPLTLASIIQAAEEFSERDNSRDPDRDPDQDEDASPDEQSLLQSPTKSPASTTDPVTELVANARRERKVQDLQIRNTSLEAINRTLERQLRKQTAELRSYRRLSRSGHLSLVSTTASSRAVSGAMSELGLESLALSDLSEEDISMEQVEEDLSLSDSDSASSNVSSSVLAARDAKHRPRDEERLKLDLSKHQQILVDSQKINQSIKRCLDWTEELIKDGKKALDYKVRVSDIRLGGRVLDPLDEEEYSSRIMPSDDIATLDPKSLEEAPEIMTSWGVDSQDRDSGIELPRDGE